MPEISNELPPLSPQEFVDRSLKEGKIVLILLEIPQAHHPLVRDLALQMLQQHGNVKGWIQGVSSSLHVMENFLQTDIKASLILDVLIILVKNAHDWDYPISFDSET